jgi:hypothetical protein
MNYFEKYLKYKNKFMMLKAQRGGTRGELRDGEVLCSINNGDYLVISDDDGLFKRVKSERQAAAASVSAASGELRDGDVLCSIKNGEYLVISDNVELFKRVKSERPAAALRKFNPLAAALSNPNGSPFAVALSSEASAASPFAVALSSEKLIDNTKTLSDVLNILLLRIKSGNIPELRKVYNYAANKTKNLGYGLMKIDDIEDENLRSFILEQISKLDNFIMNKKI